MPRTLETRFLTSRYAQAGTRFRIYPQPSTLKGFRHPETVYINAKPGTIRPGPADERLYVVDALNKWSYAEAGGEPPYRGRSRRTCWEVWTCQRPYLLIATSSSLPFVPAVAKLRDGSPNVAVRRQAWTPMV